ncbi:MAG TPA: D-aminoacyl-tRNA deacylase [Persephonella sp.]|uniref:D-aminoacyl-tRNA deacylase n=1 Tax=Persephonella marina (strain DSM 14350 / EX-H1) TaxID=123214 RepID=DTD_PERMH|nr:MULTISPECIES: D-aminoacyl-tRNA deacylase [Persephonella]C0QT00.1 RecName: Full=D-aminoacyl-tRNA deacylase; Short=DTD; AltName: Full=Gly-tRNA(Ala) deacylase [Persephonella marina EX-H1]ACO03204.1 D-tyrosyl-tRNA(Tyr) deacylase [Persephonella marina EX-H1]HCB70566.1 D-aminoacyl-tRNA deacylase [Persephonella sp.]
MIAVIQRVNRSYVEVDGKVVGEIGKGLNILLGVVKGDTEEDIDKLIKKIPFLRIFEDENGKMNLSVIDIKGEALVISQFTLAGSVKKGRRPSFDNAEEPERAKELYQRFVERLSEYIPVKTGVFAAHMKVFIENDGPVTFIIDSKAL